jgi:hypothetical protein
MATAHMQVFLSLELYARRDERGIPQEIWLCIHGHVARKDAADYYGAGLKQPDGYARCPAAKASLCEFILQGDGAKQLPACDNHADQPVEVNLSSDLDLSAVLTLSDASTRLAPEGTVVAITERRSTALAFSSAESIAEFRVANFGDDPSDTPQPKDRSAFPANTSFVELFNRNAWLSFQKTPSDNASSLEDQARIVGFLDLSMTQGARRELLPHWFSKPIPEGMLMKLMPDDPDAGNLLLTNLHGLLGLTIPLGSPADLKTVATIQLVLRDSTGTERRLPQTPTGIAGMQTLCAGYFPNCEQTLSGGPNVTIAADLSARIYSISHPTTFTAQPLGVSTGTRRWLFRRNAGPGQNSNYSVHSIGQSAAAKLRQIVVRCSPRTAPALRDVLKSASSLNVDIRTGGSILFQRYRESPLWGPNKYLYSLNLPAGEEFATHPLASLNLSDSDSYEILDSRGAAMDATFIGVYALPWDIGAKSPDGKTRLFVLDIAGDPTTNIQALLLANAKLSGGTETHITLAISTNALDTEPQWKGPTVESTGVPLNAPIDYLEIREISSFLDSSGAKLSLPSGSDLSTLAAYVETTDDTFFQFAQSLSMNEQVVTSTISAPAVGANEFIKDFQEDWVNFSSLRLFSRIAADPTANWTLANEHVQFFPVFSSAVCPSDIPTSGAKYVFQPRLQTRSDPRGAERRHPGHFYSQLFERAGTETAIGGRVTRVELQHTFGDVQAGPQTWSSSHLDFPVVHAGELRGKRSDSFMEVRLIEPTIAGQPTQVSLGFNLSWLATPVRNEPETPNPADAAKTGAQRSDEDAAVADWNRYVLAWRTVAELAYAGSITMTADARKFDFTRVSGSRSSNASLGTALAAINAIAPSSDTSGRPVWPLPRYNDTDALRAVARALIAYASGSAQLRSDVAITSDELESALRKHFSSLLTSTPEWLKLNDSRVSITIPLPLAPTLISQGLKLSDICTLLQLALTITRAPGRVPALVPSMISGLPADVNLPSSWLFVRPAPSKSGEPVKADERGVSVEPLKSDEQATTSARFELWRQSLVTRTTSLTSPDEGAWDDVFQSLLGTVPPKLQVKDSTATVEFRGDWIVPQAPRKPDDGTPLAVVFPLAPAPIRPNAFFGSAADHAIARYFGALDDLINVRYGISEPDDAPAYFAALEKSAAAIGQLALKAASLICPVIDDTDLNPKLDPEVKKSLANLDALAANPPPRFVGSLAESILRSPRLFRDLIGVIYVDLSWRAADRKPLQLPGDLFRLKIVKQSEVAADSRVRDIEEQYGLYDALIDSNGSTATFLDLLTESTLASDLQVQKLRLETFETVLQQTFRNRSKGQVAPVPRGRIRSDQIAQIVSETHLPDGVSATNLHIPSRWHVTDPTIIESRFISDDDATTWTTNVFRLTDGSVVTQVSLANLFARSPTPGAPVGSSARIVKLESRGTSKADWDSTLKRRSADEAVLATLVGITGSLAPSASQALANDLLYLKLTDETNSATEVSKANELGTSRTAGPDPDLLNRTGKTLKALQIGPLKQSQEINAEILDPDLMNFVGSLLVADNGSKVAKDDGYLKISFAPATDGSHVTIKTELPTVWAPSRHVCALFSIQGSQRARDSDPTFLLLFITVVPLWTILHLSIRQIRNAPQTSASGQFRGLFLNASSEVQTNGLIAGAAVRRVQYSRAPTSQVKLSLKRQRYSARQLITALLRGNVGPDRAIFGLSDGETWSKFDLSISVYGYQLVRLFNWTRITTMAVEDAALKDPDRFPETTFMCSASSPDSFDQPVFDFSATNYAELADVSVDFQWSRDSNHQFLRIEGIRATLAS